MSNIEIGHQAPEFTLPATGGQTINLSDFRGKNVVIYFYPKDSTPGCTTESQDFRDGYDAFTQEHTVILGISRDSIKSHERFKEKQALPFELLSDEDETVCNLFEVLKMKNMYGKQFMGIERSTFLIDASGTFREIWRKVKVKGHVEAVLAAVQTINREDPSL
ncbi:MAG TPA: thioredoxin-dependent thiol peroxidase [Gammaproteobacteria bacterium]|nr:thioredoxin-dependent thiol peroxidase [Gammaproteobacteria bacterium]